MLNNKKILITGGSGSLGKAFVKLTLEKYNPRKIVILSRDEFKQSEMKKDFPDLEYFLGDVRDADRLAQAFCRCDVVIHAAALKQVPAGENDPEEFVKTNVLGAMNVIKAARVAQVPRVVAISTDKAVSPINLYGATKLCSDKLFMAANAYSLAGVPSFSVVQYGNIMGSRGSVLPLFIQQARRGDKFTITDPTMTRFMFTLEEAVALVWKAIEDPKPGFHIADCKSMEVGDMAQAVMEYFYPDYEFKNDKSWYIATGCRPGEKYHETLGVLSSYDAPRMLKKELKEWISNSYLSQK